MDPETVKTRFLIISDTLNLDINQYVMPISVNSNFGELSAQRLPAADVLLHCGNVTQKGGYENHKAVLEGLIKLPVELKLLIAGHRDVDLDRSYYEQDLDIGDDRPQNAKDLWKSERAISNGVHYLEEGTYAFSLQNGASFAIHASPYTPTQPSSVSAFQYPPHLDRFNGIHTTPPWARNISTRRSIIPAHIDIVMTHGPPQFILDWCSDADQQNSGCEHLRRAMMRVKPRLHCFGHIPGAWGVQRVAWRHAGGANDKENMVRVPSYFVDGKPSEVRGYAMLEPAIYEQLETWEQTLFVNAAVGNIDGRMQNLPWLVELDLLRTKKEMGRRKSKLARD